MFWTIWSSFSPCKMNYFPAGGIPPPTQGVARLDFWVRDRDWDFVSLSLNGETRPRLFSSESQYRDETETFFFRVSMSRRDRDFFSSESQCRDETETFFFRVSISRRDRDFFFRVSILSRDYINHFSGGGEGTKSLIWSLFRAYQGCWTSFEGIFCKKFENKKFRELITLDLSLVTA